MNDVEVAVVGAGVMGAATAWALSKRGIDTTMLEQFSPGHDRGSSHGPTRVFRFAYEDPFYVGLAQQSLPMWRELEAATGRALLKMTGGVDVGAMARETFEALKACEAETEWLDAKTIASHFNFVTDSDGVYSPDTGVLAASLATESMLERAALPVRADTRIERLDVEDDRVNLILAGGERMAARRCVLTAGAWTGPLLSSAGITAPLSVSREQVFYFAGGDELPVVIERGKLFRYLVPRAHGAPGAKAGEHGTGERTTADGRSFEIDPEGEARVCDWIGAAFPTLNEAPVGAETCLYTNTPDEGFVIDIRGPLIFASPCSGHGFKFAPLIGEALASLAQGREPPIDIGRFALGRFA